MKNVLRSTFGALVVAACLAITPAMYAKGGHGGHRGGHGGKHAAAAHFKGGHGHARAAARHVSGGHARFADRGRGHRFVGQTRGNARYGGRAYYGTAGRNWDSGGGWGGSYSYPNYGYSRFGYYGGYGYPYYGIGYYGSRSGWCYDPYYGYYPCGSYPYRYGYGPYLSFGFY